MEKLEKRDEPLSETEAATGGVAAPRPETLPPLATASLMMSAPCEGRTEKLTTSQKVRQLIENYMGVSDKVNLLIGAGSNLFLEENNGGRRPASGAASIANEGSGVVDRSGGNGLLAGALNLGYHCAHLACTRSHLDPRAAMMCTAAQGVAGATTGIAIAAWIEAARAKVENTSENMLTPAGTCFSVQL